MQNPSASSCTDIQLLKTLKLHDKDSDFVFLEYLPINVHFLYKGSRVFVKGEKIRKRYKCIEISTGLTYLFNPLSEVELFEN
jgi:hypothetical protein